MTRLFLCLWAALISVSTWADHADQVQYLLRFHYHGGRLFAQLKQDGEIQWSTESTSSGIVVKGRLLVVLPEGYKTDDKSTSGTGWKRLDENRLEVETVDTVFKAEISFMRKETQVDEWKRVFYDVEVDIQRSLSVPYTELIGNCDLHGLKVEGLYSAKRIPYLLFDCVKNNTNEEILIQAIYPTNWMMKFGDELKKIRPKSNKQGTTWVFPALPNRQEKKWGEAWVMLEDKQITLQVAQKPGPKKPLPYPPSRWQFGMLFNYMIYSENPEVGTINWVGARLDVDHKWRMFHRFLDWNGHAFFNQSFTYRVTQSSDFPMGLLYGGYLGLGPAFKNKWLHSFWTVHVGGYAYGMLAAGSNYGFDYLAGPYIDLVIRTPHGDTNIRRSFVLTARWSALTESLTGFALANRHLNVNGEFWYNANWAIRLQWDNLYYQSLTNVNLMEWNNYGVGVVYAP